MQPQSILITGASSGIGAATALALAGKGNRIVLLARSQDRLAQVASGVRALGAEAHVYPVDLSDTARTVETACRIQEEVGTPDILFHNAGAGRYLSLEETEPDEAIQMMHVPYFAAFTLTHTFLPAMLARNSGQIINITSPAGYVSFPGAAAYSVARWAMRGFAETLWAELYGTNVIATLLVAGRVTSDYFTHNPDSLEHLPKINKYFPTLTPEQVAGALVQAVVHRRRFVAIPLMIRLALMGDRIFPGLLRALVFRSGWRRLE